MNFFRNSYKGYEIFIKYVTWLATPQTHDYHLQLSQLLETVKNFLILKSKCSLLPKNSDRDISR